ncbi:MAG: hypothetical protein NVS9B10_30450 [Nevskia sp.]
MDEKKWGALLGSAVLLAGAALYYVNHRPLPAPAIEPAATAAAVEPPPDYPVPAPKPDAPALPSLADSDAGMREALTALFGSGPFEAFLIPDQLIRRLVATLDNLPRERIATSLRPIKRTPPPLLVQDDGGRLLLSPANAERYAAQVALFKAVDAGRLVALYFRWYPLFQQAYVDLGYPGRSFNNRLVEVIDHLLATPAAPAEIELRQPKLAYEFADARLERLSAGQKTILRLGPAQREAVLAQLRAIRAAVVAKPPGSAL